MKHVSFFDKFLREEVNLNQTRIDRLTQSVEAVRRFLSNNLEGYLSIERQGSYALGTIIKPVDKNKEYDADILVFLENDEKKKAKEYINELYKCLKASDRYNTKVRRKTRCVTLEYAGDFHLDIVPCIDRGNKVYICNRKTNTFEETDGTGYRDWFNEQSRITDGNLKRITRLLKYLRDHKGNFTAPSILLTTLIGNTVSIRKDGFKDMPDALKTVSNQVNSYLQDNPRMPEVINPVLPSEKFTRHWNQVKYENFRRLFNIYNDRINEAYNSKDHNDSVEKWRTVFGKEFGVKRTNTSNNKQAIGAVFSTINPRKPYAR